MAAFIRVWAINLLVGLVCYFWVHGNAIGATRAMLLASSKTVAEQSADALALCEPLAHQ